MKTTFKKILSTVIALCVLLSSAVCLLGLSSSAETTPNDTVVYKIVYKDLNTTNQMLSAEDIIAATEITSGNSLRMSFDYYIPSTKKGIFFPRMANVGTFTGIKWMGVVHESTTGSEYLAVGQIGHIDVEFKTRDGQEAGPLQTGIGGALGTLYLWNIKVEVRADASSPVVEYPVTGIENAEKITYGEIPFGVEDDTVYNLGAEPMNTEGRTDKVMLKQENYKVREWEGEQVLLKYQKFQFPFRAAGSMKENTTYVFSFESYSDPGFLETGINSASAIVRAYDTAGDVWTGIKNMTTQTWVRTKGRGKTSVEFTTAEGQTNFFVSLESGHDGVAYYWDFKLVEKGGDGTNLIADQNLYGEWQDYLDRGYFNESVDPIMLSEESRDGLGTYSFVPFNEEMANLKYGKILGAEANEDKVTEETSSEYLDEDSDEVTDETSSEYSDEDSDEVTDETSSEYSDEDSDETSSEELEENLGGQTNEVVNNQGKSDEKEGSSKAVIIVVIVLVVGALVAGSIIILKKKNFFKNFFEKIFKK